MSRFIATGHPRATLNLSLSQILAESSGGIEGGKTPEDVYLSLRALSSRRSEARAGGALSREKRGRPI